MSRIGLLADQRPQSVRISDLDTLVLHGDQALTLETRECAADRFQLEPEIAADFLARHAQNETRSRITAGALTATIERIPR